MRKNIGRWLAIGLAVVVAVPLLVWADKTYRPNQEIGMWTQKLPEGFIKLIRVEVVRTQGSARETFLNAAFGKNLAFENAQRKYLTSDQTMKIEWKVNAKPEGKELRILCHHGKCTLKSVAVDYKED